MSDLARSRLQVVMCRNRENCFEKRGGLGREKALLLFPPPPTFPNHARLISAWLVFATSYYLRAWHRLRVTTFRKKATTSHEQHPMQSTNDWSILEICRVQLPFHFRAQSFLYALALGVLERDRPGGLESLKTYRKSPNKPPSQISPLSLKCVWNK